MRKRRLIKDLAIQRAAILYNTSVKMLKLGLVEVARRETELGLRLLRKARARKPLLYRRYVCRNCLVPLIPGLTARVRIRSNRKQVIITLTCLQCGWVMRKPCAKKKQKT